MLSFINNQLKVIADQQLKLIDVPAIMTNSVCDTFIP